MNFPSLLTPLRLYRQHGRASLVLKYYASRVRRRAAILMRDTRHALADGGVFLSGNDRRLVALKDCHRGRRAFVVASGPSLRVSDLDRLKGEITFACNKIYLAFGNTTWRPTYYSVYDVLVAENNREAIDALELNKVFGSFVRPVFGRRDDVTYVHDLTNPTVGEAINFQFSPDLLRGAYGGYTVVQLQLQMAYYMGIREVYVIGLDFSFTTPAATGEKTVLGEAVVRGAGETNHFHKDYRKPGEKWTMPQLQHQEKAFRASQRAFAAAGGMILNASRQSALEVFPRVDFDTVVKT